MVAPGVPHHPYRPLPNLRRIPVHGLRRHGSILSRGGASGEPEAVEFNNVVGHLDARGNVDPREAHPEQKIDAAVALIMALGRAIIGEDRSVDMDAFLAAPLFS